MSQTDIQTVPFNDLGRGTTAHREDIDRAITRVLDSGWYVMGPEHDALEADLSEYLGTAHSILVANGTDALQLALSGLGVGPGNLVLTAANAGGYTSTAVELLGATAIYADVDPRTHLLSVETLERAVETAGEPKVVVITHLFGAAADMVAIMEWAGKRGIAVIEDCAQSLGAITSGRRAGSFGDVSTTSFYPTKNLGALGDGGAVFTSRDDVAGLIRQQRQYGWRSKYVTDVPGGRNSRMDELQAAIVRTKLPHLDAWNERRREIHLQYESAATDRVRFVNTASDSFVGHLAVIEVDEREAAKAIFEAAGVRTDVHYPMPDHRQPLRSATSSAQLPVTESLADRILSLPLFPELTQAEIDRVVTAIGLV